MAKNLILLLSLLIPALAFGNDHRWTHFGPRPLAMGNAFIAVVDDYNALFYNPAGLARLKDWGFEIINPGLEVAADTINAVSKMQKLANNPDATTDDVLDLFQSESGKTHHFALYLTPYFVMPHFGFGIGFANPFTMVAHSNINVNLEFGPDIVAPFSFAMNFLEKRLSVGASLKFIAKGGLDHDFNLQTMSAFTSKDESDANRTKLSDLLQGGYGYGADLGMLFTPIKTMEPTLGISITDIGGSVYQKANIGDTAVSAPDPRPAALNTGISIKPIQSGASYVLLAMDSDMINQPVHYSHKLNLGAEYGFGKIIKLQTGLHDGYLTGGMQFDVGLLKLRLATYTVDHGPVVGLASNLAERRYLLQLNLLL